MPFILTHARMHLLTHMHTHTQHTRVCARACTHTRTHLTLGFTFYIQKSLSLSLSDLWFFPPTLLSRQPPLLN